MPPRLIHLSASTRASGNAGGVEKFGWYLERATNCEIVTRVPSDIGRNAIVIADFHWANHVPHNIHTVCFIHGVMRELAIRVDKVGDFAGVGNMQHQACQRPNTTYVASSPSAAHWAEIHHGLKNVTWIGHGVDPAMFWPTASPPIEDPIIVLHAASDYVKNSHMVHLVSEELKRLAPGRFRVDYLNARIGEEPAKFARGHLFLHPSHYEGNSYACLEALMAGLPLIVSETGFFEKQELEDGFGEVMPRDASPEEYARRIIYMANNYKFYNPREWALKHANYDNFASEWCMLLSRIAYEQGIE